MNTIRIRRRSSAAALVMSLIVLSVCSGTTLAGTVFSVKETDVPPSRFRFASSPPPRYQTDKVLSKGKFLVARRDMTDPRFSETVILLIEYGVNGAMGLVINQPTGVRLSILLPDIKGLKQRDDTAYLGGPVNENQVFLLIRSRIQPKDSLHVFDDIYVSASLSELQQLIEGAKTGEKFHAYAGIRGGRRVNLTWRCCGVTGMSCRQTAKAFLRKNLRTFGRTSFKGHRRNG